MTQLRSKSAIYGKTLRPRVRIFRSDKALYAQVIDDENNKTMLATDTRKVLGKIPTEKAKVAGLELAKKIKAKKIENIVYDRSSYRYHGQVKAFADGLREGGIKF